jgi:hypothetical protein
MIRRLMENFEAPDALSEITLGIAVIVFLLLWFVLTIYAAVLVLAAIFIVGYLKSSPDSPAVLWTLIGLGLLLLIAI